MLQGLRDFVHKQLPVGNREYKSSSISLHFNALTKIKQGNMATCTPGAHNEEASGRKGGA